MTGRNYDTEINTVNKSHS